MKKENRLLKNTDFSKVYDYKHRYNSLSLAIYFKRNDLNKMRVGLSVSKKVGKAHVRVRVRRVLRAVMDKYNAFNRAFDIIIVAKAGISEKSFNEIYEETCSILNRFIKENLDEKTN